MLVYTLDQLKVRVDVHPIGGYRGTVGALTIDHVEHRVFTDWSHQDLLTLSKLKRMILHIHEQAQISNTLVFGKQDQDKHFKLSLIPYPKCNLIEKIQGFVHVIFGSPNLKEKEIQAIAAFYQNKFDETLMIPTASGIHHAGKPDPFCRESVIKEQCVRTISYKDPNQQDDYHILYDKYPKGNSSSDPHFLAIPDGDAGHCEGSKISEERRFRLLTIAQSMMKILLGEQKFPTLLLLERNGEKLQGVRHKSVHVLGIEHFPSTFWERIQSLFRQFFAGTPAGYKQLISKYHNLTKSIHFH